MAKQRSGGRVTPKGTQPAGTSSKAKTSGSGSAAPRAVPGRTDPGHARASFGAGPVGKARSGHHGGNR